MSDIYRAEVEGVPGFGPADVTVELNDTHRGRTDNELGQIVEITVIRTDAEGHEIGVEMVLSMAEAREVAHGLIVCLR